MKNFLIVKTSAIGDVIQTLPVASYLKERFPDCSIDWVCEKASADLLQAHPFLDRVLVIDSKIWRKSPTVNRKEIKGFYRYFRSKRYDRLFDLQGNSKSALITSFARADVKVGYTWDQVPEKPNFFVTNKRYEIPSSGNITTRYLKLVQNHFEDNSDFTPHSLDLHLTLEDEGRLNDLSEMGFQHPRIMVCFGSKWPNKRLPANILKDFLLLIEEKLHPYFYFIYGNPEEKELAEDLHLLFHKSSLPVGEMSLALWQSLMNRVDLVLSMDSAALHLCGTTNTPSFSIFGPSSSQTYKPLGENHGSLQGSCPYGEKFDKRCSYLRSCKTGACISDIALDRLFKNFYSFWTSVSKSSELVTT